jgi:DNA-3-methyladenine glycosylase
MNDSLAFLNGSAETVAPRLLGCILERTIDGETVQVRIVETEAYDESDAASHSFRGKTPRTEIMFGPAGYLYVYFTYGMHYCCNVVTSPAGHGAAVLLRAGEPLSESAALARRRPHQSGVQLTNGPAKLCQALGIDRAMNGHDLSTAPLCLISQPPLPDEAIVQTVRIGIRHAVDVPWRFFIRDNPYVSKQ